MRKKGVRGCSIDLAAFQPGVLALALALALFAGAARAAQEPSPKPLVDAVESYLFALYDDDAEEALDALLAREDASAEALLSAVRSKPAVAPGKTKLKFPFENREYEVHVTVPEGHDETKAPLPLLFCVGRGVTAVHIEVEGVIFAHIYDYAPKQFSDDARDIVLKAARIAARASGADRIWLTGYSWAAHASYDTALHRPGVLRGIAPTGGGPRRVHYRLLKNLQGLKILAYCGAKDDPELVWNLREVDRRKKRERLDYELFLDESQGHNVPVKGYAQIPQRILATATSKPTLRGTLYADANGVESPLLRCVSVDPKKVTAPKRVSISAKAKPDAIRRAWIRAMDKHVATVKWSIQSSKKAKSASGGAQASPASKAVVTVLPKHVRELHVLLRPSHVEIGQRYEVRRGSKLVRAAVFEVDRRVLLEEARRTQERMNPALQRIVIK